MGNVLLCYVILMIFARFGYRLVFCCDGLEFLSIVLFILLTEYPSERSISTVCDDVSIKYYSFSNRIHSFGQRKSQEARNAL